MRCDAMRCAPGKNLPAENDTAFWIVWLGLDWKGGKDGGTEWKGSSVDRVARSGTLMRGQSGANHISVGHRPRLINLSRASRGPTPFTNHDLSPCTLQNLGS